MRPRKENLAMRSIRPLFILALTMLAVLATTAPALATPVNPGLFYTTAVGAGSTMAQACANAATQLREECTLLGPISYDEGRCLTTDPPGPIGPITLCDCTARTLVCWNPLG